MRIFGTKCSHCGRPQLALDEQLGCKVKCAHCMRTFVCLDETGELPFVKAGDDELASVRFEKQITRAFFEYGIGVPPSMHDVVRSRLSRVLSMGEKMPAKLRIGNESYPIEVKWFENHRGAICLHLLWTAKSGVVKVLSNAYADAYKYYVVRGGTAKHPEWKVDVSVTTEEDIFVLDEDRMSNRCRANISGIRETRPKIRKSDAEFLEELLR